MKETLLLIEDELELQQNLKEILEFSGFKLITADHGEEALQKLQTDSVDLVISDIMMPVMDGYQFLKKFKSIEDFHHIPLIFMSAKARNEDREKGLALGADDYLTKPISSRTLLNSVFSVLERKRNPRGKTQEKFNALSPDQGRSFETDPKTLDKVMNCLEKQKEAILSQNWAEVAKQNDLAIHWLGKTHVAHS